MDLKCSKNDLLFVNDDHVKSGKVEKPLGLKSFQKIICVVHFDQYSIGISQCHGVD